MAPDAGEQDVHCPAHHAGDMYRGHETGARAQMTGVRLVMRQVRLVIRKTPKALMLTPGLRECWAQEDDVQALEMGLGPDLHAGDAQPSQCEMKFGHTLAWIAC